MLMVSVFALAASVRAETLAERLLAGYAPVQTVSCEARKDTRTAGGSVRMLSRVFYERPDRLHVENVSPIPRRIVCDGTNFFSFVEGDPKGFSRPVGLLDEEMAIQLRKVPGTAMDHLMRLEGVAEDVLSPTAESPVRRGYATDSVYFVICCDATGRLARIELYPDASMKNEAGAYTYEQFEEVLPGVWMPMLHRGRFRLAGVDVEETSRFTHVRVNEPIAPRLFVAAPFFEGVAFVDRFEELYPENP